MAGRARAARDDDARRRAARVAGPSRSRPPASTPARWHSPRSRWRWARPPGRRPPRCRPFTVGSKWGYTYTADWRVDVDIHEVKDLTLATLQRQEHESIALLGESLGLYQIHSATLESGVLSDNAVLDELAQLRAAGFAIGLSVSGPRQGETILAALEAGGFDAVQATFNLLDVSAGPALAQAHAAGSACSSRRASPTAA